MRNRIVLVATALVVMAGAGILMANKASDGEGICITISPNTLVLSKDQACVTVHTNIAIGAVQRDSVLLEGIAPYLTKADSCGDLVAKFSEDAVKSILEEGQATLTLTGLLADGTEFSASDTVTVRK
jgi:hypothetical protein